LLRQKSYGETTPTKNHTRINFAPEINQIIHEEVEKLLQVGFIREVDYPEWLANVVLVKKSSGDNPYKRNQVGRQPLQKKHIAVPYMIYVPEI
jgi:hypothetical protein